MSINQTHHICGNEVETHELALALYHIAENTEVSRNFTLKYVQQVQRAASQLLLDLLDEPSVQSEMTVGESLFSEELREWLLKHVLPHNEPDHTCEYHWIVHSPVEIRPHTCPNDHTKICGCCTEGELACAGSRGSHGLYKGRPVMKKGHID